MAGKGSEIRRIETRTYSTKRGKLTILQVIHLERLNQSERHPVAEIERDEQDHRQYRQCDGENTQGREQFAPFIVAVIQVAVSAHSPPASDHILRAAPLRGSWLRDFRTEGCCRLTEHLKLRRIDPNRAFRAGAADWLCRFLQDKRSPAPFTCEAQGRRFFSRTIAEGGTHSNHAIGNACQIKAKTTRGWIHRESDCGGKTSVAGK